MSEVGTPRAQIMPPNSTHIGFIPKSYLKIHWLYRYWTCLYCSTPPEYATSCTNSEDAQPSPKSSRSYANRVDTQHGPNCSRQSCTYYEVMGQNTPRQFHYSACFQVLFNISEKGPRNLELIDYCERNELTTSTRFAKYIKVVY